MQWTSEEKRAAKILDSRFNEMRSEFFPKDKKRIKDDRLERQRRRENKAAHDESVFGV